MVRPLARDSGKLEFRIFCQNITEGQEAETYPISAALRQLNIKLEAFGEPADEEFLSRQQYRVQLKKEAEAHHHRDVAKIILSTYDNLPYEQKGLQLDNDTVDAAAATVDNSAPIGTTTRAQEEAAAVALQLKD